MPAAQNALSQRMLSVWVARGSHTEPPFPPFYLVSTFLPRFHLFTPFPPRFLPKPPAAPRCCRSHREHLRAAVLGEMRGLCPKSPRAPAAAAHPGAAATGPVLPLAGAFWAELSPWRRNLWSKKKGVFHLLLIKSSASERAAPRALMVYVDQGKW